MAVYNKFSCFTKDLVDGKHNFSSHTYKVFLTNTKPTSNMSSKTDMTEVAPTTGGTANGYPADGAVVTITATTSGGVAKVAGANAVITASGAAIGPFQYAVIYNSTTAGAPVVAWWDYGSALNLAATEILTLVFDATNGILTVT